MKKPRLILHIGSPKTGSSSIQKILFASRRKLKEECDVHFASTDRHKAVDKHLSTTKASTGSDIEKADAEYAAIIDDFERSGAGNLFITEEQMWSARPSVANFFRRFTHDFDVDVIAYVRRQDLFVEGLYSQHIRLSNYKDVPPITDFWRDPRVMPLLDYHRVLTQLARAGLNVKVLEFSTEVKKYGLMASFMRAAGFEDMDELPDRTANTSPDMRLLLTLCMLSTGRIDGVHQHLVNGIFRAARRLDQSGVFPVMKHTLGRIERQAIIDRFAETNVALERDFGITFPDSRPQEADLPILAPDAAYLLALIGDMSLTDSVKLFNCCRLYLENMGGWMGPSEASASNPGAEAASDGAADKPVGESVGESESAAVESMMLSNYHSADVEGMQKR